jgi:hypothetical protein
LQEIQRSAVPHDEEPWWPFQSWLDFEVAELALKANMSEELTNMLCSLLLHAGSGNKYFNLKSYAEIMKIWDLASHK